MFKPVLLIPIYNHADEFARYLPKLVKYGVDAIVVDDGSLAADAAKTESAARSAGFEYLRIARNSGKGAAFKTGFEFAAKAGYTHVLQVDADGQHNAARIGTFLEQARANPHGIINSYTLYRGSVPRARYYGRKFTNMWVYLETADLRIRDSMSGFRVYPVAETLPILEGLRFMRMGFDIEIIVKASWRGLDIKTLPVETEYSEKTSSHFRVFGDNILITALHTYLCSLRLLNLFLEIFGWKRQ